MALLLQPLCRFVLGADLIVHAGNLCHGLRHGAFPIQPGGHPVICHLGIVVHLGAVDIFRLDAPVLAHHVFLHDSQAIHVGIQGCQVRGKLIGKHGEYLGRRINRGRIYLGMFIDGRILGHQAVHIGDGDKNLRIAVGELLADRQLVQVL